MVRGIMHFIFYLIGFSEFLRSFRQIEVVNMLSLILKIKKYLTCFRTNSIYCFWLYVHFGYNYKHFAFAFALCIFAFDNFIDILYD